MKKDRQNNSSKDLNSVGYSHVALSVGSKDEVDRITKRLMRRKVNEIFYFPNMRISIFEKEAIVNAITACDPEARVWLFGSRADDSKKGGDIDIGILSAKIDFMQKLEIKSNICEKIGEQKIDLIISKTGNTAFFKYAVIGQGVVLNV